MSFTTKILSSGNFGGKCTGNNSNYVASGGGGAKTAGGLYGGDGRSFDPTGGLITYADGGNPAFNNGAKPPPTKNNGNGGNCSSDGGNGICIFALKY